MKGQRVGTLTMGTTLIAVGVLYLLYHFMQGSINLIFILQFWPLVLISLGCEVLLSYFLNREDRLRYDGAAIFITICTVGMAWCMAAVAYAFEHGNVQGNVWYF